MKTMAKPKSPSNPPCSPEAVKKIHSWFENLTTNGFQVPSFKQLAVRPELRRRATAIFLQLPLFQRGTFLPRVLTLFGKACPESIVEGRGGGDFRRNGAGMMG